MLQAITEWDLQEQKRLQDAFEQRTRGHDEALFGTVTHTSLYAIMDELGLADDPNTVFMDMGSGYGHILFYMYDKYPHFKRYVGIEYSAANHAESERRLNALPIEDRSKFELRRGNIKELDVRFLNDLQARTLVIFGFDTVMPLDVVAHIKNLVYAYEKPIIWVTNKKDFGGVEMRARMVTGPPGVTEMDAHARVVTDGEDNDIDDDYGLKVLRWMHANQGRSEEEMIRALGPEPVYLDAFFTYAHRRNEELLGYSAARFLCITCGKVF